jgi:AP-1 complex subunit beta-1
MSAVKVILTYLPLIDNQDALRLLSRKLAPPLVSLLNSEPEIQYVALRNINLIVQQRPRLLDHEIKVFFCKYNDPIYVKMEKLEIIIKLVSERNVDQVLMELREYAQEVDVDFVRRAVRAIGRCAIKLERAAERCISVLLELIQSGVNYVVQEGIVVIKDIFRRYPNRYESIISTLCENLETLDEPEAKSSMIWIIGEYCDRIDNADDLLDTFLDTFQDETPLVQLQLLTAIVKLYLKREDADVEDMVTQVLNYATQECDNPDLRDRGYLYWRLLSASPEAARTVVLSERPNIGDDTFQLDDQLLDDLVRQLSTLASVYHKPPSSFIMRALPVGGASQGNGDGDDDDEYGSPYIEEEGDEEEKQGNGVGEVDLLSMDDLGFGDSQEEETKGQDAGPSSYPQQSVLSPSDGAGLELIVQSLAPVLNDNGTPSLALSVTTINHNGSVSVPKIAFQFNKSFFGFSPANPVLAFDPPLGGGMSSTQRIVLSPVAKLLDQDPASKTSQNVTSLQVAVKNFGNNNVSYFLLPIALPAFLLPSSAFPDAVLDPATLGASWVSIDDSLEVSSMVQNVRSSELNFIKSALGNSSLYYIADRPVPNTADQRFIYFSGQSVDMSTTGAGAETVLVELRTKENTNAVKVSVKTSLPKLSETVLAVITAALCD